MSLFHRPRRLGALAAAAALAGLAFAGNALAADPPASVTVSPSLTNADAVTVSWSAVDPGLGGPVTYEVSLDGGPATSVDGLSLPISGGLTEGVHSVSVASLQDSVTSAGTPAQFTIDRTPPDVSGATPSGTASAFGWYSGPLNITFATCSDNVGFLPGACTVPWTQEGSFPSPTVQSLTVTDAAGNQTAVALPSFSYDNTAPARADLTSPLMGAVVASEPTFHWFPRAQTAPADLSGIAEYRLQYQLPDDQNPTWKTIAVVKDQGLGLIDYAATRDPSLQVAPLPDNQPIDWRVVTYDKAGNLSNGRIFEFTIDPTVPPAPEITGGPVGPTSNTTPTFSWNGGGNSFRWDLIPAGAAAPSRSGNTAAQSVTLGALADGAYTFRVTQVTAAGRESADATRAFIVDTVPPDPPTILTRPTFPSVGDAIFTWSTEPGAYSRWSVIDAAGNPVVQPTDTPVTNAKLPQLAEGTYSFSVQQIDAAGNVGPATVEPFTVIAPLVQPNPTESIITILPKQNARRLQPKAGKTVFTRRPLLRWSRGPRGTKLFNLQLFRVTMKRGAKTSTPKVTKVLSAFPKQRAYRVPKSKQRPKTCYVWRVWPYTGRQFTPKPLGVSNYCIASSKVLKTKARIIAKRKALKLARARSARRH